MAADPTAAARIKRTGLGIIPPPLGMSALATMLRVVAAGELLILQQAGCSSACGLAKTAWWSKGHCILGFLL